MDRPHKFFPVIREIAPAPPTAASANARRLPPPVRVAVSLLMVLMPLSLVIHGRIKALVPLLLLLLALGLLASRRDIRATLARAWPVTACALVTIAYAIANTLGHGLGFSALDGAAHVLLYLIIAAVFAGALDMRILWSGMSLTAIGFGLVGIVQHFAMGIARVQSLSGGASTSIEFATLLVALALMALIQLLRGRPSRRGQVLHGLAIAFAMYGALLTQSRGPLLAFVPICLGLIVLRGRLDGHWRKCLGLLALLTVGATVAIATLHGHALDRFVAIDQQLAMARAGAVNGSVSERLEMWRTATRAVAAHPWAGLGLDQFSDYLHQEVAAGRTSEVVARYNNPHNMYLGAAAAGGLPGLLVLLAMFVLPLGYFARRLRARDTSLATAAWAGLAVVVLYMLCAITDSVFYRVLTQSFYYLFVLGLAALIAWREGRGLHQAVR